MQQITGWVKTALLGLAVLLVVLHLGFAVDSSRLLVWMLQARIPPDHEWLSPAAWKVRLAGLNQPGKVVISPYAVTNSSSHHKATLVASCWRIAWQILRFWWLMVLLQLSSPVVS
jgi:hypothetical protein